MQTVLKTFHFGEESILSPISCSLYPKLSTFLPNRYFRPNAPEDDPMNVLSSAPIPLHAVSSHVYELSSQAMT
jgi:hypothetical protein